MLLQFNISYLFLCTVEGCPDPDLPAAMWMRRDAHEALVGCKLDTPTKWILKCVNGIWEGQVGICPAVPASSSGSASASLPAPAPALRPIPVKTSVAHFDNGVYIWRDLVRHVAKYHINHIKCSIAVVKDLCILSYWL